jgi:guanylate kinase
MAELRSRLQKRASETHESLAARLKVAQEELKSAKDYDFVIINASLDKAKSDLEKLVIKIFKINN